VRAWIDEGKKTKYLDCPGLGDSRGVWQQIFNSLAMQNLKATENLKIMLVLPHNAFFDHTQAHNFLRETAQYLKSFFGDL
jgi:hypothetical protein